MHTPRRLFTLLSMTLGTALAAQTDWQQFTSFQTPPGGRNVFGLCFDSHRQRSIMFGGQLFGGFQTNETWEFDGGNWVLRTPPAAPSGRLTHMLAYDSARQVTVLFGGGNSFGFQNDTWEWNGTVWLQRQPAHQPPVRGDGAFAYDELRRRVVLFGGWDGTRRGDTWEYDGVDWTQRTLAHNPAGRSDHFMVWDSGRSRMVLYGGYANSAFSDTWEYDGADWTQRSPAHNPGALADAALAYDRGRGRVVLFGGSLTQFSQRQGATWEYDGVDWTNLSAGLAHAPSARWVARMTYDEARGRTLIFGGIDNFNQFPNDTWELVTPQVATQCAFGRGCGGLQLLLGGNSLPRLGANWGLRLTGVPSGVQVQPIFTIGFSNASTGSVPLPQSLNGLGAPGCTLYVSPDLVLFAGQTNGTAVVQVPVPNQAALLGLRMFAQGGVLAPSANAAGILLADAAAARVGR